MSLVVRYQVKMTRHYTIIAQYSSYLYIRTNVANYY